MCKTNKMPEISLRNIFICIAAALQLGVFTAVPAYGQTNSIVAPDYTAATLEARATAIAENPDLSEEQKTEIKALLSSATENLQKAANNIEEKKRFIDDTLNVQQTLNAITKDIEAAQADLFVKAERLNPLGDNVSKTGSARMREEDLFQLERDLIARESELQALRSSVEGIVSSLELLGSRQTSAPADLNTARTRLGQIMISLADLGKGELGPLKDAQRRQLRARQYFRETQISTLEQEIFSLPQRQEILAARRNLTQIQVESLSLDVQYLQKKTGQQRLEDADTVRSEAQAIAEDYENFHPIVGDYAAENVKISQEILSLAQSAADLSKRSANILTRQDDVKSDLRTAQDLIEAGSLDRTAGATLRRLSNQLLPPAQLRSQIENTRKRGIAVTQKKLITQDKLRSMPLGRPDIDKAYALALTLNPEITKLTETDRAAYAALYRQRRDYFTRILAMATTQNSEVSDFIAQQNILLEDTESLRNLLDEKLLWVPSVPAVNLDWPRKILVGWGEVFSPANIKTMVQVFVAQLRSHVWMVMAGLFIIFGCLRLQTPVWQYVKTIAKKVGRVREDTVWHTPVAVVAGMFMALPVTLSFVLLGSLFAISDSHEPFINGLARGLFVFGLLSFLFITWRSWDRDDSLFDAHFNVSTAVRCAVHYHLRWFLPIAGVLAALLVISTEFPSDNSYEGVSLLIFILFSLSISVFFACIFYARKAVMETIFASSVKLFKFRKAIIGIAVVFPLLIAIFAAIGYYASAYELLYRAFLTCGIFLSANLLYGVIRRAITVAQRQIMYRQALVRRDAELKARAKKIEAEQLGEDAPAAKPIELDGIDVSAVTRQSMQLVNTIMALGVVLLLWMNWSSLLPALTVFDGLVLASIDTGLTNEDNTKIIRTITLWTVLQGTLVLALTFIAAKNLPSFLEIFAISRLGVDSGVRYAVKTIIGYVIVAIGVIWAFNIMGVRWSQLRWVVTGLSVGIGFGLQKIIANFVSGLIILFERPVRIGDYVTIGDQSGTVSQIKIRATTLNDLDNLEILIPNEALISERVTNWTLSNSVTRLIVRVGIAYGSDTDAARDLMHATVKAHPKVLDNPAPQVFFVGFGDSSLDFEIRVFLNSFEDRAPMRHAVHTDIYKALENAGFSIPFPQRDLNIVSQKVPLSVTASKAAGLQTESETQTDPTSS